MTPNSQLEEPIEFSIGNVKCSTHTIAQFVDEVAYLAKHPEEKDRALLCLNAHIYNLASKDETLRAHLNNARVVTADGMSIVWYSRVFGLPMPERCNMTEAFRAFLQSNRFRNTRGILIGSTEAEATKAARAIETSSRHCTIVRAYSGYLPDKKYKQLFKSLNDVDFIFVGMGTPRTERIIDMASRYCPRAIAWGIGGGTIRIYSGTLKEASPFWRRNGLQWLHRLVTDPVHLWHRYLVGNPLFILRALRHGLQSRFAAPRIAKADSVDFAGNSGVLTKVLPNPRSTNS